MDTIKKEIGRVWGLFNLYRTSKEEWILEAIEEELQKLLQALGIPKGSLQETSEPVDIISILREVVKKIRGDARRKNVDVELLEGEEVSYIKANPYGLHEAILHTLVRAIDESKEGDVIKIGLKSINSKLVLEIKGKIKTYSIALPVFKVGKALLENVVKEELKLLSKPFGVIILKLRGTEEYEDVYGDKNLRRLYKKLKESLERAIRERDLCFGDERERYLIALRGIEEKELLERIKKRLEGNIQKSIKGLPLTIESTLYIVSSDEDLSKIVEVLG